MKNTKEYNKLVDALNIIDEHARDADAVRNNDNGEAQELEKAYRLVADFIEKHAGKR